MRVLPLVCLCLVTARAAAPADAAPPALRRAIDAIVARPELSTASWGIEVRSLATGKVLYAHDAERALRPASTLKIVTTAAALDALGPENRVRTSVETGARLDAYGRVLGDVYLVGRGDAFLSSRSSATGPAPLEGLADALVAAGVRRIEGRLVGHEGLFAGDRRGHDWTWEDLVWGYGTEVSALSIDDNAVELQLRPGERSGDPALLDLASPSPVEVTSSVVTGSPQDVRLERFSGSRILLSGRLPIGAQWSGRVAVEDPARHAASVFAAVLERRGVRVTGGVDTSRAPLPVGLRVLASHDGPTVREAIRLVNKDSLNLQAESLLRLVGVRTGGEGSVEKAREAVFAFLTRMGAVTRGFVLSDGSGLARTNLVTASGMTALLAAMDRHPCGSMFRESLPIAGVDGTLERRMRGTPAQGRVFAKTGTIAQAHALAGYAVNGKGVRVAFVAIVNNHAGTSREAFEALDAVALALATR